jgi:K+-sensing histidine kinase KdpD
MTTFFVLSALGILAAFLIRSLVKQNRQAETAQVGARLESILAVHDTLEAPMTDEEIAAMNAERWQD